MEICPLRALEEASVSPPGPQASGFPCACSSGEVPSQPRSSSRRRVLVGSTREALRGDGGLTTSLLSGSNHRKDTQTTLMSVKLWHVP